MTTLTGNIEAMGAFLLARIAEDEAAVDSVPEWHSTDSARGPGWGSRGDCPLCDTDMFDGTEAVTEEAAWEHLERVHRRSRMLAECAAKRKIVESIATWCHEVVDDGWYTCPAATEAHDGGESYRDDKRGGACECGRDHHARSILMPLVSAHAGHPEFLEEWRS